MKPSRSKIIVISVIFFACLTTAFLLRNRPQENPPSLKFLIDSLYRDENTQVVKFITEQFGENIHFQPVYLFTRTGTLPQNQKDYLTFGDGQYYTAPHGRSEANQNIREICALKIAQNLSQWWQFVTNFSDHCSGQNPDTCWSEIAARAGLNPAAVTNCFNQEAQNLIESQLAVTSAIANPQANTILVNDRPVSGFQIDSLQSTLCQNFTIPPAVCRQPLNNYAR